MLQVKGLLMIFDLKLLQVFHFFFEISNLAGLTIIFGFKFFDICF